MPCPRCLAQNRTAFHEAVVSFDQHASPPDVAQAADHYQQALTLAEILGMRPLQPHCHFGLGTPYTKRGVGNNFHHTWKE